MIECLPKPDPTPSCGLYLHAPYCHSKCGYCDFYSVALGTRDAWPVVRAIGEELDSRLSDDPPLIRTIFFGGGTPTVLDALQLRHILRMLNERMDPSALLEFTVEANPATVDDEKAALLVSYGVTRVSMGAQSFFPDELASLERLHSPDDIDPSVAVLRRHGVGQINLDLIFGIPGQTLETWTHSLRRAIDLNPDHIACYGLTYEPGTRLTEMHDTGRLTSCDNELEAEMYLWAIEQLGNAGFLQYEISNFAKPGRECRHNLLYWHNEPYVGVGPSATGCLQNRRYKNIADVNEYVRRIAQFGDAEASSEEITPAMLIDEMLMMQLRLSAGLDLSSFHRRTGLDATAHFEPTLTSLRERGMIRVSSSAIALTHQGRLIADAVIAELAAGGNRRAIRLPVVAA